MPELLSIANTELASADFTLAAGESATLNLKATATPVLPDGLVVDVQIKSGTDYFTFGGLSSARPVQVLQAPGTFRVLRRASVAGCGVDRS